MTESQQGAYVVGIDIGGTTRIGAVADARGQALRKSEARTEGNYEAGIAGIARHVTELLEAAGLQREQVTAVGVGVPGRIDSRTGESFVVPNIPGWNHRLVAADLQAATGLKVAIGNDVNCAALGELRFGAGRDVENLLMITLGTGIGSGIAINNEIYTGPRETAGEIGHITLDPNGPRCGCGNHGCFEALAGRDAIIDRAVLGLQHGRASSIAEKAGWDLSKITPRLIADAAHEGDALALDVLEETGHWIGIALSNAVLLLDPDIIIIGGGIANAGEPLFEPIRRTLRARCQIGAFDVEKVVQAELGTDAGVWGTIALALESTKGSGQRTVDSRQ